MDAETEIERRHPELVGSLSQGLTERAEDNEAFEAENLLDDALAASASDIHLDPAAGGSWLVRLRIDGALVSTVDLEPESGLRLVNQIKTLAGLDPVTAFRPEDGRFSYRLDAAELDVRVTLAPCLSGEKLAIRLLRPGAVWDNLADLGVPEPQAAMLDDWLDASAGMLLVTGPTGAGKTTTLYTLLHRMRRPSRNIVTLEDPVEYDIDGINPIPVNAEAGLTFAEGTRSLLRLDPDCLLVGEIRDRASARAAGDVAATGRTLMGSLHSRDAVSAVTVLRNYGLDDVEIAGNLEVVVSQRLVRRLCPDCREQRPIGAVDRRFLERLGHAPPDQVWWGPGCSRCRGLGYQGRTAIVEVWSLNGDDQAVILEGAPEQAIRRHLRGQGHRFLLDAALELAENGVTTLAEVRQCGLGLRAVDPQERPA